MSGRAPSRICWTRSLRHLGRPWFHGLSPRVGHVRCSGGPPADCCECWPRVGQDARGGGLGSVGPAAGKLAWVSLDEGDSDPRLFWSYVLAALRHTGAVPAGNDLAELVLDPQLTRR